MLFPPLFGLHFAAIVNIFALVLIFHTVASGATGHDIFVIVDMRSKHDIQLVIC